MHHRYSLNILCVFRSVINQIKTSLNENAGCKIQNQVFIVEQLKLITEILLWADSLPPQQAQSQSKSKSRLSSCSKSQSQLAIQTSSTNNISSSSSSLITAKDEEHSIININSSNCITSSNDNLATSLNDDDDGDDNLSMKMIEYFIQEKEIFYRLINDFQHSSTTLIQLELIKMFDLIFLNLKQQKHYSK